MAHIYIEREMRLHRTTRFLVYICTEPKLQVILGK